MWALSGTYGASTYAADIPPRACSASKTQDSKFRMGVLHILYGALRRPGMERTHFGIFATQVWKLFPRGQTIHLNFWDYNDVARWVLCGGRSVARDHKGGDHSVSKWRDSDFPVADRSKFADTDLRAAAKGLLRHSRFSRRGRGTA